MDEKLRLDKYLWSIRIFKTRSQATAACEAGKVKCNEENCKASRSVKAFDVYDIKTEQRRWVIKVAALLYTRKQYSEAINFYIDQTPQEYLDIAKTQASSFNTGKRLSKIGRPTKKQKRDLDGFLELD